MTIEPTSTKRTNKQPLIRAGEFAHYGFCRRAWWLSSVKKIPAANHRARSHGVAFHRRHSDTVALAKRWRQVGFYLLGLGGLLVLAFALFWLRL